MAARGACAAASDFPVFLAIATELLNTKPTTKVEATSILPSLNVKTARLRRAIVSLYAPRTGGAYDSHHRTAGIAGRTRRRGGGLAAPGARADEADAADRRADGPCRQRPGGKIAGGCVRKRPAGAGMGQGTQPLNRVSLGRGRKCVARPRGPAARDGARPDLS